MNFQKILIATDFSDFSSAAISRGFDLARKYESEVLLLHVVATSQFTVLPPIEAIPDVDGWIKEARANAAELMEHQISDVDFGGCSVTTEIHDAETTAKGLIERASAEGVDLIVMGTHGRRGLRRLFMGSVAEEVVRLAPCAVLTCAPQAEGQTTPKRILAAVDFSEATNEILETAKELAESDGAELRVVHVVPTPHYPAEYAPLSSAAIVDYLPSMLKGAREALEARVKAIGTWQAEPHLEVVTGRSSQGILGAAESWSPDLIVIGSRGLSGAKHLLLGSVADLVVRRAECPVLVLHASHDQKATDAA